ncbi:MAG: hypothetical protein QXD94_04155 [Sulfolobales archaeon]
MTDDKLEKLILEWLSHESDSHSLLMKKIYELLNIDVGSPKCPKLVGEPWKVVDNVMKEVDNKRIDLLQALTKMEFVEGFTGEEMYNRLLFPILKNLLKEFFDEDASELIDKLMSEITDEEAHHDKMVKALMHYEKIKRSPNQ